MLSPCYILAEKDPDKSFPLPPFEAANVNILNCEEGNLKTIFGSGGGIKEPFYSKMH